MAGTILPPKHDLAKRLTALEQQVAQLATRDVLQNASIGAGGLTVNSGGSIRVLGGGSISVADGGEVTVDGVKLSGVTAASASTSTDSYALSTTPTELVRMTFTVPAGYTQASILATASITCFNQSTTADQIWGYADINGGPATEQPGWTPPVSGGLVVSENARLMTGLAGGNTFYVRAVGWNRFGNTGVEAGNLNTCVVSAQVLFLR